MDGGERGASSGGGKKWGTCDRVCLGLVIVVVLGLIAGGIAGLVVYLKDVDDETTAVPTTTEVPIPENATSVTTPLGEIYGRLNLSPQGKEVKEYLGIPYAVPPVGSLRFTDPQPLDSLPSDPFDAASFGPPCMQTATEGLGAIIGPFSEDCLTLNVWVPEGGDAVKAVMVWIYGGGFSTGSSAHTTYHGASLATENDVIVVSMNYRLGPFGFLSTGDGRVSGNFGLKDQAVAIKWVAENIAVFGGDTNRVTLFGESAGAASAGWHLLTVGDTPTADYFQRAIFQSGVPLAPFAYMSTGSIPARLKKTLDFVECSDDANVLECLRNADSDELLEVAADMVGQEWLPTTESNYIPDHPLKLTYSGAFQNKDLLVSTTKDEGSYFASPIFSIFGIDPNTINYDSVFPILAGVFFPLYPEATTTAIRQTYAPGDVTDPEDARDALFKILTDQYFLCPSLKMTDMYHEASNTIFMALFAYRSPIIDPIIPEWLGVSHALDLMWTFGTPLIPFNFFPADDVKHSKDIMAYWANFAKNGDPNGSGLENWPQYTTADPRYLVFGGPDEIYDTTELLDRAQDTYCPIWEPIMEAAAGYQDRA